MVAVVIAACKKKQETLTAEPQETVKNADKVLQHIKNLGFPESSIVDNGNEYIVEEDIILKCSFVFGASNFHALNGYPFVLFGLSCENFESTDTNKLSWFFSHFN